MKKYLFDNSAVMMFAVRREDGTVDEATTVAKFQAQVRRLIAQRETEETTVGVYVDQVFDSNPGVLYIPAGFLVNQVLTAMKVTNDVYPIWDKRIKEYLSENGSTSLESSKTFHVKQGKGYARRRELPTV